MYLLAIKIFFIAGSLLRRGTDNGLNGDESDVMVKGVEDCVLSKNLKFDKLDGG